jgi:hypothetical protein
VIDSNFQKFYPAENSNNDVNKNATTNNLGGGNEVSNTAYLDELNSQERSQYM